MIYLYDSIKNYISGKRYDHTIGVERECRRLAEIYGLSQADTDRLRIAGLLHDITKEVDFDGQLKLCEKYNIEYDPILLTTPQLFHAVTGAEAARDDFARIVDDTVYNAIRCHTTGRENMNIIDKLLLLADYIEETRKFKNCVKLRKYFYNKVNKDNLMELLDETLIMSFNMTIKVLIKRDGIIDIQTVKSRNFLLTEKLESCYTNE
jgi:putative HD superfamily hydrolase of NAD metabolism